MKFLEEEFTSSFASKLKKLNIEKMNKLANANENLLRKVIKEKRIPEISSLNLLRCISLKSAWIDGGIIKSAPRQKPVTQDITMKGIISPESNKKTEVNKQDDKIREIDQVSFSKFLANICPKRHTKYCKQKIIKENDLPIRICSC